MSNNASSGGIGFLGLLTIVFVTLKLLGKIDWNWFWVLSPVIIPIPILLLIIVFAVVMAVVTGQTKRRV